MRGIDVSDVVISRIGNDVFLDIAESAAGAGDGARLELRASIDGAINEGIDRIRFEDGTEWTRETFVALILAGEATDGNDVLEDSNLDDTLAGGLGNDVIVSNLGQDTFVYNRGDGNDTFQDIQTFASGTDTVELRNIAVSEVTVRRDCLLYTSPSPRDRG